VFQDALAGLGPVMVRIPGGCFQMGSPESEPERYDDERQHRVCVDGFMIGRYAVTFAEYDAFAEATGGEKPHDRGWGRGRRPVINVSWDDATAYAQWLSEQTGQEYRLPTEAEWEYAARAGSTTAFWWGDTIHTDQANYNGQFAYNDGPTGEYRGQTVPVGQFEANAFGLYDVHGNVWEWTCSNYDRDYAGGEASCAEPGSEGGRVLRGGSWVNDPWRLRSAGRFIYGPAYRLGNAGFRLARAVP
jgi:formylglycine-generating enzyme required for sulfatase activity